MDVIYICRYIHECIYIYMLVSIARLCVWWWPCSCLRIAMMCTISCGFWRWLLWMSKRRNLTKRGKTPGKTDSWCECGFSQLLYQLSWSILMGIRFTIRGIYSTLFCRFLLVVWFLLILNEISDGATVISSWYCSNPRMEISCPNGLFSLIYPEHILNQLSPGIRIAEKD